MEKTKRILFAKGGLDGHDQGSDIFVQALRDAGFEVIYTSIYQSPEEIAKQAIEEDPDIVGVSIHSGAHKGIFGDIMSLLAKTGESWIVVGGGLIPARDHEVLKTMGVREVFGAGASVSAERDIIPRLKEIAMESDKNANPYELYERMLNGDRRALAKFITLLDRESLDAADAIGLFPLEPLASERRGGDTHVVGFSGSGGVGKSSLIAKLLKALYREHKIAVLCVDPLAVGGGAVLGDRCRIQDYDVTTGENVFIRSLAAHWPWQGVTKWTPLIIKAMAQAGFETVFVESVGVGQEDLKFKEVVDTFVYVASPSMGDSVQALKGGAIQTADIIVLNQCSRPGADMMESILRENFGRRKRRGWTVPILKTDAVERVGIEDLWKAIERHKKHLLRKSKNAA